jgi:hypothetical protein
MAAEKKTVDWQPCRGPSFAGVNSGFPARNEES